MPAVHLQQVQQIKTMPLASFYKCSKHRRCFGIPKLFRLCGSCTKTRLHLATLGAARSKYTQGGY